MRISNAFDDNFVEYRSNGDKEKPLPIEKYFNKIKPYLSGMINDLQNQGEWKIHLTIVTNFFSSKDSRETRTINTKSNNIKTS